MILELINESLTEHGFLQEFEVESTRFYKREMGDAIRFAILHELSDLLAPAEINSSIMQLVPDAFINNPSFKKNCDLICVYRLNQLAEFKNYEEQIFALEEDPQYFKKYVLYYSEAEELALNGLSYQGLQEIISSKDLFNKYKEQPLTATNYSVAAKIFIKLPFLELPFNRGDLVPLRLQAEGAVKEEGLGAIYEHIQTFSNTNADDLIKEMINDELANK